MGRPKEERPIQRHVAVGEPVLTSYSEPVFEQNLLTSGKSIVDSFTIGVFPDMQSLVNACLYIGQMQAAGRRADGSISPAWASRIQVALYKLNGSMAIDGRARDEAVQAHVGVFFPRHASDKDKKRLETMQYKHRSRDDRDDDEKPERE